MRIIYKSLLLSSFLIAFSCEDFETEVGDVTVSNGNADFSKYVSIGNSLTSGYADGALYKSAQEQSFPSIIGAKMEAAGGATFTQPLMPNDIGGFSDLGVSGKYTLQIVDGSATPVAETATTTFAESVVQGSFSNVGVPGAKSFHLLASGYGNPAGIATGTANPYFARFASSTTTTVLADAVAQQPTFFTLWIGNNDVLSYATSGGNGVNQTGNLDPSTYGSNDITDPNVVAASINQILETLVVDGGAKGAIANIPEITAIPHFTTVPAKPLESTNQEYAATIPTLNAYYANLNAVYDYLQVPERKINFDDSGASGVIFVDDSLPNLSAQITQVMIASGASAAEAQLIGSTFGQVRQSGEGDLIPLSMSSRIATVDTDRLTALMQAGMSQENAGLLSVVGLTYPLDELVLSSSEVQEIATATTAINQAITQLASTYQLALVDMNARMETLQSGITYNGVDYNATFVSGGAFSLDGVHLNPRGYAVVANYFIEAINSTFGSTLMQVNPNNYTGTEIP